MRAFAALIDELEAPASADEQIAAVRRYLGRAPAADAAWAVFLLAAGTLPVKLSGARLRALARARAGLDEASFAACARVVGDAAETIALVWPAASEAEDRSLAQWIEERLLPLQGLDARRQDQGVHTIFECIDGPARLVAARLLVGALRSGLQPTVLQRALAAHGGVDPLLVARRLADGCGSRGRFGAERLQALLAPADAGRDADGSPLPFAPAPGPGQPGPATGDAHAPHDFIVEWAFDGAAVQLVRRAGRCWIWSRDGQLLGDRLAEIVEAAGALPADCVLEGELLAWRHDSMRAEPGAALRRRLARKAPPGRLPAEAPAVFIARDLLELGGADLRAQPLRDRHRALAHLMQPLQEPCLRLLPPWPATSRAALETLRAAAYRHGATGLLLRARDAAHGAAPAAAWLWPSDPLRLDAVLMQAQPLAAGLACGFALWDRPPRDVAEVESVLSSIVEGRAALPGSLALVPVAQVVLGAGDEAFETVAREVHACTLRRFGPVRSLRPRLVVELGFVGISASHRHRCGFVLHHPRVLRIRSDRTLLDACALPRARAWLDAQPVAG